MTTNVFKTIGPGGDYADFNALDAALPASFITADQMWYVRFTGNITVTTPQFLTRHAADATRHLIIEPGAGLGFRDNAGKLTNPFFFDSTKGASFITNVADSDTPVRIDIPYTEIRYLQMNFTATSASNNIQVYADHVKIYGNIIKSSMYNGASIIALDGGGPYNADGCAALDNLIGSSAIAGGLVNGLFLGSDGNIVENNTIVSLNGSGGRPIRTVNATNSVLKNNISYGFTTAPSGTSVTGSNNATDLADFGPGVTGTLASRTATNDFIGTSDFRLKSTSTLIGAGIAISGETLDALGQTRASPPAVGAVEYAAPVATPVSFSGPVPTRNGAVGSAASFANAGFFAGSLTPFAYTNVGAALPAGLTLSSSTGIISGTPTTAATTSGIIIRATDTGSNVANTNSYSIVIAASNAAPTFPGSISNISGTNGSAITPVNVSGQFSDTDALAYSASPAGTAWPSWASINASTGVISGTPTGGAVTTTGCKVRATDTASQPVDSNSFNFVIAAAGGTTKTYTSTKAMKRVNGTITAGVSLTAIVSLLDGTYLGTKTGVVTNSSGVPAPFTGTFGTAGTATRIVWIEESTPTNPAPTENVTPT